MTQVRRQFNDSIRDDIDERRTSRLEGGRFARFLFVLDRCVIVFLRATFTA